MQLIAYNLGGIRPTVNQVFSATGHVQDPVSRYLTKRNSPGTGNSFPVLFPINHCLFIVYLGTKQRGKSCPSRAKRVVPSGQKHTMGRVGPKRNTSQQRQGVPRLCTIGRGIEGCIPPYFKSMALPPNLPFSLIDPPESHATQWVEGVNTVSPEHMLRPGSRAPGPVRRHAGVGYPRSRLR